MEATNTPPPSNEIQPSPLSTQTLPRTTSQTSSEKRWLVPDEHHGEHIAIVSYPRSGNSLMRGLLETVTGVYTGCDTRPDRSLSLELQKAGMKGEGVVDDRVWFVKSHYPERSGYVPVPVQKAILVVRNPWDAINSYFNMTLTNSHNKSVHDVTYSRFADRWDAMIQNEIQVWIKFHAYWIAKVDIPIQIVRSFRHYSPDQFQHVLDVARVHLRNFGYDTNTQGFPHDIRLPNRQLRPAKPGGKSVWTLSGDKLELRDRNDTFGRLSTWFRKALTEPIVASDGTNLNMHEVEAARERALASAQSASQGPGSEDADGEEDHA
ncbi:hypothetical protein DYB25_000771 [Aphanomyces astaci]|uniref:Sulfotransferase domain-containing protein n=1 Tax=Aphanomyces astaci TaxID=112090 RepID=A0A397AZC8_APHAT|nr:hypothetical protein DYB25_000771 [Aphanomyces astaci]RHY39180.1 hypothetical protein DYB30_001867 [Aphanomyces astaci]RHZ33688.1 hypothetical protein DYB31_001462 [Aphanomyces astaci]